VATPTKGRSQAPVGELVTSLSVAQLREVVSAAAEHHEDVERAVRLIAARGSDDLAVLRAEVDRGLRTRRFLPYAESSGWAYAARPIAEELRQRATTSPSAELVELLQRAIGHVTACDSGVADP
jgi:hypothetical protein